MRSKREEFPEYISVLINLVSRGRYSPEPSLDPEQEEKLEMLASGAPETDIQRWFREWVFTEFRNALHCSDRMPMAKRAVLCTFVEHRVGTPKPDLLYGYERRLAFPQHCLLGSLSSDVTATASNQAYPFLDVEFKGDGPSGCGSIWVATNQCLGGAASCVNLAERLNDRLQGCKNDEIRPLNRSAFSIVLNGRETRLFVCWKHKDLNYYLQEVEGFLLSHADHYLLFRRYVRNIIGWGKGQRLQEIRDSDKLLEEDRKRASPDEYGASDTLRDDNSNSSDPEEVWWGKKGQEQRGMQSATAASSSSRKAKRRRVETEVKTTGMRPSQEEVQVETRFQGQGQGHKSQEPGQGSPQQGQSGQSPLSLSSIYRCPRQSEEGGIEISSFAFR
ncbi:hypothetical protein MMC07_007201 [Pseudocyphellaria aurata]|nr:hypothetical protein [Pseudocyphellaria aurata]